jgi:hypothetical protein
MTTAQLKRLYFPAWNAAFKAIEVRQPDPAAGLTGRPWLSGVRRSTYWRAEPYTAERALRVSWGAESAARRAPTAGAARRRERAPAASRERGDRHVQPRRRPRA